MFIFLRRRYLAFFTPSAETFKIPAISFVDRLSFIKASNLSSLEVNSGILF
jgi:hypothetical protein